MNRIIVLALLAFGSCIVIKPAVDGGFTYNDRHRPQIHFTPQKGWMNDPNGMVYHNGTYHLFFQHHPHSTQWGPMHWGHATSKDLVHWQEKPIALYPDSLGTIFSGSAVVDKNNTAGFGNNALVAIYTSHSHALQDAGSDKFETQSIAYSNDDGKNWKKYSGNPVLKNPGIRDFRDPKVMWYEPSKKWIMTLATLDHISFYSSPDLKSWKEESKFGKNIGAHGGVWECPDLFSMTHDDKEVWVLIVNVNPGGPNGGAATQYFVGDFNGSVFTPFQTDIRWLDYGPDEYAGVTWNNTGDRKVFMGWMSNPRYANNVPTEKWRSAMTIARDLNIEKIGEKYLLTSKPVKELDAIAGKAKVYNNIKSEFVTVNSEAKDSGPKKLSLSLQDAASFQIVFSDSLGEELVVGFNKEKNEYFIDRTKSGKIDFDKGFPSRSTAPRLVNRQSLDMILILDNASIELFADGGLTAMTAIFFPNEDYNKIEIKPAEGSTIQTFTEQRLKRIW